jgi:hypothetical protein
MIANIVLGTSETTIKATGSSEQFALLSMIFCNTSASDITITVYAYPSGGSAGTGTMIIQSLLIPSHDSYIWDANEKFILGNSSTISGLASLASSITVTTNGMSL